MTPNDSSAFCRLPSPLVAEAVHDSVLDTREKTGLCFTAFWECIIFHTKECRIYDGTKNSKLKFEDAAGIKPMHFAQAWLERPGLL